MKNYNPAIIGIWLCVLLICLFIASEWVLSPSTANKALTTEQIDEQLSLAIYKSLVSCAALENDASKKDVVNDVKKVLKLAKALAAMTNPSIAASRVNNMTIQWQRALMNGTPEERILLRQVARNEPHIRMYKAYNALRRDGEFHWEYTCTIADTASYARQKMLLLNLY